LKRSAFITIMCFYKEENEMVKKIIIGSVIAAFTLGGCANMTETQKGTAKGAAIGAGAGAVVGAIAGKGKGAAIGAVVGGAAGAVAGNVWSKKMEAQKKEMEQATEGTGVAVTQTEDNRLKLEIPSDISFAVGSARVEPNFQRVLDTFATGLVKNPSATVTIIGHTDSSGSDAVNNPLSLKRATSVRDYLVTKGVGSSRFLTEGRGSREPLVANDTKANMATNRRVEIFVAEPAPVTETAP
jgi:outer membrane protein OmpA-like peptidoglycan-associated protein